LSLVSPVTQSTVSSTSSSSLSFSSKATSNDHKENENENTKTNTIENELSTNQLEFLKGYLNKHHSDLLKDWARAFTDLGTEMSRTNGMTGGTFVLVQAAVEHVNVSNMLIKVTCQIRAKERIDFVQFALDSPVVAGRQRYYKAYAPVVDDVVVDDNNDTTNDTTNDTVPVIDRIVRKLCRLCWIVGQPQVTGKLLQLAMQLQGSGIGKLPENMYLNQVPHNRYVRRYFYETVTAAVQQAVTECAHGKRTNRMLLTSQFPEMNPAMDSYRIGTLLEMARCICIGLAEENLRVRLCVQGSMGQGIFTGMPKQLSGVNKLVQMMDWQSGAGQENEGMLGDYVNFGAIGADHVVNEKTELDHNNNTIVVQHQDDVFVLIAPQSMVGTDSSIMPLLQAMVHAAGDRPVILINPDLTDRPSSAGQQSVRGRQERLDFAASFETIYHFCNIYVSGTSYFPILGTITKLRPNEQWIAYQRRDFGQGSEGEIYVPVLAGETIPSGQDILEAFER
jgi:adenylate kinase